MLVVTEHSIHQTQDMEIIADVGISRTVTAGVVDAARQG